MRVSTLLPTVKSDCDDGTVDKAEDDEPVAAYAVLAIADQMKPVDMQRVPYEVAPAAKAVRAGGLPMGFADPL